MEPVPSKLTLKKTLLTGGLFLYRQDTLPESRRLYKLIINYIANISRVVAFHERKQALFLSQRI